MTAPFKLPDLSFTQTDQEAEDFVILFAIRKYVFDNQNFHKAFPNKFDLKHYLPEPYNSMNKIESTLKRLIRTRQITNKLVIKEAGIAKLIKYDAFMAENSTSYYKDLILEFNIQKPIVHRFAQMKQANLLMHFHNSRQQEQQAVNEDIKHHRVSNLF